MRHNASMVNPQMLNFCRIVTSVDAQKLAPEISHELTQIKIEHLGAQQLELTSQVGSKNQWLIIRTMVMSLRLLISCSLQR